MITFTSVTNLFDLLHNTLETPRTQRRLGRTLVLIFLLGVCGIEAKRWGLLPESLAQRTPTNYFAAVNLAFTMVLMLEVLSLVFVLALSVSRAVGKQLEILALILLRNAFKELGSMHDPISMILDMPFVLHIATASTAALLIFIGIGVYYRLPQTKSYIPRPQDKISYIMAKKIVALGLFTAFLIMGGYELYITLWEGKKSEFFSHFYSILIFADILLVLIGQCFMPSFHAVFRASGYVAATLFMRMALGAPPFYDVALALFATAYAVALTWASARFDLPTP